MHLLHDDARLMVYTSYTSGMTRSFQRGYEFLMAQQLRCIFFGTRSWPLDSLLLYNLLLLYDYHRKRVSIGDPILLALRTKRMGWHVEYFDWYSLHGDAYCLLNIFCLTIYWRHIAQPPVCGIYKLWLLYSRIAAHAAWQHSFSLQSFGRRAWLPRLRLLICMAGGL